MPSFAPQPLDDPYMVAQERAQDRQFKIDEMQANRDAAQAGAKQKVYDMMADDPQNAPEIAKMYGMEFTPSMQAIFSNRKVARLAVDGAKLADSLQIENPAAASAFVKAYLSSNGNILEAQNAIGGLSLTKPEKATYSHIKSDGMGNLVDVRSGKVIYGGGAGAANGQMPVNPKNVRTVGGSAVDVTTGRVIYNDGDLVDDPRLPASLRMQGKMLMSRASGFEPPTQEEIDRWTMAAESALSNGAGTPAPVNQMPLPNVTTPTAPAQSSTPNYGGSSAGGGVPPVQPMPQVAPAGNKEELFRSLMGD
jgi:hypothetical protein